MSVHIGKIIQQVFKDCPLTHEQFAIKIGYTNRDGAYKIFKKKTIDTGLLVDISKLLKHDFFQYYVSDKDYQKAFPATKDDVQQILQAISELKQKR